MRKWRRMLSFALFCLTICLSVQVQAEEISENETAKRMKIAQELGLEEWIDEEGYLIDSFFEGKSDAEVSNMSLDGLVRTLSTEEIEAFAERLQAGIGLFEVSKYTKVSQLNPNTGRYLYTGIFEVDGILAYCIERDASTPAQGSATGPWIAVTNENMRKVLYHGYAGPADKGYTYVETSMALAEANGRGDNSLGRNILAEIQLLESPPDYFYVWKVETNDGETQELAFYTHGEPEGELVLQKVSANPGISNGNSNYSLTEAEYGVYADSSCSEEVGYLVTDESGVSNTISLPAGDYYVKELVAPKGYLLDSTVKMVTVVADETINLEVTDEPVIPLEVIKYNEGFVDVLAGAQFKLMGADGTEEVVATDENGTIVWSGLQLGSYTLEEIEAPDGYIRNRNIITFEINESNQIELLSDINETYGKVILENNQIKVENKTGYQLPNTGSCGEVLIRMTGILSLVLVIVNKKRRTNI